MHRLCIIMCVNDISCGCTIYDCTAAVIVTQHHCCADRERKTLTVLITCTEHKLNTVSYWLNGNISHSLLDVIFCVLQYQEKVLIIETNIDLFIEQQGGIHIRSIVRDISYPRPLITSARDCNMICYNIQ